MKPAARSSRYALLAGFGVLLALLVATTVLGVTRTDLLVVIGALAAAAAILIAVFVTRHVRRVEYALQLENELAQVTLHSIGDGVITTDSQGRVEYLNPVAEQYTGWTTAEARGRPVTEVYRVIDERSGQPLDALERPPEPASEGRGSGVGAARSAQRPRVSDPLLARADPQPGGAGARHDRRFPRHQPDTRHGAAAFVAGQPRCAYRPRQPARVRAAARRFDRDRARRAP